MITVQRKAPCLQERAVLPESIQRNFAAFKRGLPFEVSEEEVESLGALVIPAKRLQEEKEKATAKRVVALKSASAPSRPAEGDETEDKKNTSGEEEN